MDILTTTHLIAKSKKKCAYCKAVIAVGEQYGTDVIKDEDTDSIWQINYHEKCKEMSSYLYEDSKTLQDQLQEFKHYCKEHYDVYMECRDLSDIENNDLWDWLEKIAYPTLAPPRSPYYVGYRISIGTYEAEEWVHNRYANEIDLLRLKVHEDGRVYKLCFDPHNYTEQTCSNTFDSEGRQFPTINGDNDTVMYWRDVSDTHKAEYQVGDRWHNVTEENVYRSKLPISSIDPAGTLYKATFDKSIGAFYLDSESGSSTPLSAFGSDFWECFDIVGYPE